METGTNEMVQKRRHARLDYELEIEMTVDEDRLPGKTLNISPGGMLIATDLTPDLGSKLTIFLQLPGVNKPSEISCIVRWTKPGQGIGVQFERLRAIEIWALNKLMRDNDMGI